MFVVVAVQAEQFPIAAIRRVVVVVVIFVVNGQFAQVYPGKACARSARISTGRA